VSRGISRGVLKASNGRVKEYVPAEWRRRAFRCQLSDVDVSPVQRCVSWEMLDIGPRQAWGTRRADCLRGGPGGKFNRWVLCVGNGMFAVPGFSCPVDAVC
jgi:hypothetical protein